VRRGEGRTVHVTPAGADGLALHGLGS
jgi:hypothetical protein